MFEGHSEDQVWSAMVAAARTPEYEDWKVRENEVFVDEQGRRLEVYRVLKRLYVTPFSEPRKEDREWRIQIVLAQSGDGDAPAVDFTARQLAVPAHVWNEADVYFAQVRSLLGAPAAPAPQATPEVAEEALLPPPLTSAEHAGTDGSANTAASTERDSGR